MTLRRGIAWIAVILWGNFVVAACLLYCVILFQSFRLVLAGEGDPFCYLVVIGSSLVALFLASLWGRGVLEERRRT